MKLSGVPWRDSATLLIFGRNVAQDISCSNFKILVTKRSQKSSFMPSVTVFPGGAISKVDENNKWLKLYQNLGISNDKFKELLIQQKPDKFDFQKTNDEDLEKEISLRICAIRETFEEVGLLMCKSKNEFQSGDIYSKICKIDNSSDWQKKVHNNSELFFDLCQHFNVAPDIWSLYLWSIWLTPLNLSKRFKTAFFCVGLQNQPNILADRIEVADHNWESAITLLEQNQTGKTDLGWPQMYEMFRLVNVTDLDNLLTFAKDRSSKGSSLYYPFFYKTADGMTSILPGDSAYPENMDLMNQPPNINDYVNMSNEEFLKSTKNLHRFTVTGKSKNCHSNIDPLDGHLPVALPKKL